MWSVDKVIVNNHKVIIVIVIITMNLNEGLIAGVCIRQVYWQSGISVLICCFTHVFACTLVFFFLWTQMNIK